MCKYCDVDSDFLINKDINCGVLGVHCFMLDISYDNKLVLSCHNGEIAKRAIKYCPMCGEKLKRSNEK